jgi:endonuclease YncB( thermonuclease family)
MRGLTFVIVLAATTVAIAEPIEPEAVRVIDGDTIAAYRIHWRVVGFDALETFRPQCQSEQQRGREATARLAHKTPRATARRGCACCPASSLGGAVTASAVAEPSSQFAANAR